MARSGNQKGFCISSANGASCQKLQCISWLKDPRRLQHWPAPNWLFATLPPPQMQQSSHTLQLQRHYGVVVENVGQSYMWRENSELIKYMARWRVALLCRQIISIATRISRHLLCVNEPLLPPSHSGANWQATFLLLLSLERHQRPGSLIL